MTHFTGKSLKIAAILIAACALTGCGTSPVTSDSLSIDDTAEVIAEEIENDATEETSVENTAREPIEEAQENPDVQEAASQEYLIVRETGTSYYKGWPTEYTTDFHYDSNGYLVLKTTAGTEQDSYSDILEFSSQTEYAYDDAGNMVSETQYDSTGAVSCTYMWEYDDAGNKVSQDYTLYYSGSPLTSDVREYHYDSDGNCISEFCLSESSGELSFYYTYEYDAYGNVTKCSYFNEAGESTPSSVTEYIYTYDENGNILTKETVDTYETSTQTYIYDENGLLLNVTDDFWSAEGLATTTYEYDAYGNVISEIFALGMTDDDPTTATSYSHTEYAYSLLEDITVYDASTVNSTELTEEQKDRIEDLLYPISMFVSYGYADYNADDPAYFWNIMDAVINSLQYEAYCPEGSSSDLYISYPASVVECIAGAVFADFTSLPEVSGTSWVEYADGSYLFLLGDLPWVDDYTIQPWEDNGDGTWNVRTTFTGIEGVKVETIFTITPNTYAAETGNSLFLFSISGVEVN